MRQIIFLPLLVACTGHAQYAGPESVEYDPVGDRYFVSCTDDNSIRQRAQDGTVSAFVVDAGGAPYGIELMGDTLFANVGGSVRGFRTSDGSMVSDLDLGASFLTGLTTDGHFLYTTDFSNKTILKVDPVAGTFSTLVSNTVQTPNGIVFDPALNRLWVACWGGNARIKSYDRESGAELSSYTTSLGNIDGITLDCNGDILVASWSPGRITRFEPSFTAPAGTVVGTGLSSPADIDYDDVHHVVCVPNSGNNTVVLPEVTDCSTSVGGNGTYRTINAYPNPADGRVRVDLPVSGPEPFLLMGPTGLLVGSGTLLPGGLLDVSTLPVGTYVFDFTGLMRYVRVVKK
ncbi:MAG TPA: hypothetical protein P5291_03920 [Flavobacteriales bacterium]|nr:hypothetical protein [Flavobacteriales bacterium]